MYYTSTALFALASAVRGQANAHITEVLARHGITDILPAHGAVLHCLAQESPLQMSELAKRIDRKKNTITSVVRTLEERGYCKREICPNDARAQRVSLTEKGKKLVTIQENISPTILEKAWKGIPEEERNTCIQILAKVLHNLEEQSE